MYCKDVKLSELHTIEACDEVTESVKNDHRNYKWKRLSYDAEYVLGEILSVKLRLMCK